MIVPKLHIFSASKLVVKQVTNKFAARETRMAEYLIIVKTFLIEFKAVKIEQVGRDLNSQADVLAGIALVFEGRNGWMDLPYGSLVQKILLDALPVVCLPELG